MDKLIGASLALFHPIKEYLTDRAVTFLNHETGLVRIENMTLNTPAPIIVWFKRDLRVFDHEPLWKAARFAEKSGTKVIPLYVVEPDYWALPDTSGRQWDFIRECLESLRNDLSNIGAPLIIRNGNALNILGEMVENKKVKHIFSHEETGNLWTYRRDQKIAVKLRRLGCEWHQSPQFGVQRGKTDRDGWAAQWDYFMSQPLIDAPSTLCAMQDLKSDALPYASDLSLFDACLERQRGGRANGLATLESFLLERGQNYRRKMSSPLTADTECSRLSTFISTGTLSLREITHSLWMRQRELKFMAEEGHKLGGWRGSMSSFNGRLHWHCHFIQKIEDEPEQELSCIHPFYEGLRDDPDKDVDAAARLLAWSTGQTGYPFVDACMRSLNATGWINFRMRAMLMAVASYHLWLDWRASGLLYAQKFTDYEPGIHWPQVQMQSGTTGINTLRVYNPVKQGYDQDPKGIFIRKWIPELNIVPDDYLHEPWAWGGREAVIPEIYPDRIVNHLQTARDAKSKIYGLRKREGHWEIAQEIVDKHGSRKKSDRTRPSRKTKKKVEKNLEITGDLFHTPS